MAMRASNRFMEVNKELIALKKVFGDLKRVDKGRRAEALHEEIMFEKLLEEGMCG